MELLLTCRAGFEKEVAAEISDITAHAQVQGYVKARAGDGFARFVSFDEDGLQRLVEKTDFQTLTFIRQWLITPGLQENLPQGDRVAPLLQAALSLPRAACLVVEHADTNEGKSLAALGRSVGRHLQQALQDQGHWQERSQWQLQLMFVTGDSAFVGASPVRNSARWPNGVPRLRLPKSAPSRATLKLEEAWHHFIPKPEWDERLRGGMRAVDLGAAPGGWTWQLVNKSMWVHAVDNGPMNEDLMESGQVTHHRTDGFHYTPARPVDWLVCDIADKPARVAAMIAKWGANRWCREAVFNLKLPMKQRYAAVQDCRHLIESKLAEAGVQPVSLRFKQLYHDREEVTGHLRLG
jgi:23S rRNA (cytidine2498-2'-O)-methyltransferase